MTYTDRLHVSFHLLKKNSNRIFLSQPWTILQSLSKEKQREAISAAITAIYEGPNVPKEVKTTFSTVMNGIVNIILYPITSTQLGVFNNFLDLKKFDVLEKVDARAKEFKENVLDVWVRENQNEIDQIDKAKKETREGLKNLDTLWKEGNMNQDEWAENWKRFEQLKGMRRTKYKLRELFSDKLKAADPSIIELPSNILHRWLRNNPRLVAGTTHTFNLLGTAGALYSIVMELATSDSGVRQGNWRDTTSVVATFLGGVGSFAGSVKDAIDLIKYAFKNIISEERPTERVNIQRTAEDIVKFEDELVTEVGVDLSNMERFANRNSRVGKLSKIGGKIFTVLGVFADTIFFGLSVYDLVKDFNTDSKDPWKIADDFLFLASSGVGAVIGKCL